MVGDTDAEAQEGVRRYWSARALANSMQAARAVTGLAGRLRASSATSMSQQNASGTAVSGVNMNFVGSPDTVFPQLK
jgi:hypothetical protein